MGSKKKAADFPPTDDPVLDLLGLVWRCGLGDSWLRVN